MNSIINAITRGKDKAKQSDSKRGKKQAYVIKEIPSKQAFYGTILINVTHLCNEMLLLSKILFTKYMIYENETNQYKKKKKCSRKNAGPK